VLCHASAAIQWPLLNNPRWVDFNYCSCSWANYAKKKRVPIKKSSAVNPIQLTRETSRVTQVTLTEFKQNKTIPGRFYCINNNYLRLYHYDIVKAHIFETQLIYLGLRTEMLTKKIRWRSIEMAISGRWWCEAIRKAEKQHKHDTALHV